MPVQEGFLSFFKKNGVASDEGYIGGRISFVRRLADSRGSGAEFPTAYAMGYHLLPVSRRAEAASW